MLSSALFIGRFQPFHNGHLDAIANILQNPEIKTVFLGIGSAEENFLPENPFTAGERFEMIAGALSEAGITRDRFFIVPIRNIHHYALWTAHVREMLPPFRHVFSGSPIVRRLFSESGEWKVHALTDNTGISATKVRTALKMDTEISGLVPPFVAQFLAKKEATARLRDISHTSIS